MTAGQYTVTIDGRDRHQTTHVVDVVAGRVVDVAAD